MRVSLSACALATLGVFCLVQTGWGQFQTTTTSGGLGASGGLNSGIGSTTTRSSTGSTGSTSGTFGNRSLGSGTTAGNRSFASGTAGGRGTTGIGGTGGMGGMGTAGGMPGAAGNVGQANSGQQFMQNARSAGFVGADSRDVASVLGGIMAGQTQGQSANQRLRSGTTGTFNSGLRSQGTARTGFSQPGMMRSGGTGGFGTAGGGFGMSGGAGAGYGRGTLQNREVPSSLRVAFEHRLPVVAKGVNSGLTQRLSQAPGLRDRSSLQASMLPDGTAVLRGTVATDHARAVAERLVRLEPGIWKVQNELTVASSPPAPPEAVPAAATPSPPAMLKD